MNNSSYYESVHKTNGKQLAKALFLCSEIMFYLLSPKWIPN